MLENEKINSDKLAYDRPSPKLIGFLSKHYGLKNYIPQNNNFVIFNQYWEVNMNLNPIIDCKIKDEVKIFKSNSVRYYLWP